MQGNVTFETGEDQEHAQVSNPSDLKALAHLLSVDMQALERALLSRVIAAGGNVVEKQLNVNDALYARDAFAKVSVRVDFGGLEEGWGEGGGGWWDLDVFCLLLVFLCNEKRL